MTEMSVSALADGAASRSNRAAIDNENRVIPLTSLVCSAERNYDIPQTIKY
jgi:hypothetical protein